MIRFAIRFFLLSLAGMAALTAPSHAQTCRDSDISQAVMGQTYCLVVKTLAAHPGGLLVVLLHGDLSRGGPATYHVELAQELADANPNATVVAMLRPGYDDGEGHKSDGDTNNRRDHYTARNIDAVAAAIGNLKAQYKASRAVLIGHSGGAAFAGVIAGRHPGLADAVALISCPCDIPVWRANRRAGSSWPNSLSPSDFAAQVPPATTVVALVGTQDTNTPVSLSRDYISKVSATGAKASLVEISGAGHNVNERMRAAVLPHLSALIAD